jgi:hypothetical protein
MSAGTEVGLLSFEEGFCHVLKILDLLWACVARDWLPIECSKAQAHGHHLKVLLLTDVQRLISATAMFCAGNSLIECQHVALASPLVAALLGLRPSTCRCPTSLLKAWPHSLTALDEPCLLSVIEECSGNTATDSVLEWVVAWPKLLWYLGASDAELSEFILLILLELAKLAQGPGDHRLLFAGACPLLVPFVTGSTGGTSQRPPLASLPHDRMGPQRLVPPLLSLFPSTSTSFTEKVVVALCHWSDIGTAGGSLSKQPCFGADCCEALLRVLLFPQRKDAALSDALCSRCALTILTAKPIEQPASIEHAIVSERTSLRLCDVVAEWATRLVLTHPQTNWEALEAFVFPLSKRMAARAALAPRALCFLFFAALRLPPVETSSHSSASGECSLHMLTMLQQAFDLFLQQFSSEDQDECSRAIKHLTDELWEDLQRNQSWSATLRGSGTKQVPRRNVRSLCLIFVAMCMRAAPQREALTYEALVKLSVHRIFAELDAVELERNSNNRLLAGLVGLLCSAIEYRNSFSLPVSSWGHIGPLSCDAWLRALDAHELKDALSKRIPVSNLVADPFLDLRARLSML